MLAVIFVFSRHFLSLYYNTGNQVSPKRVYHYHSGPKYEQRLGKYDYQTGPFSYVQSGMVLHFVLRRV